MTRKSIALAAAFVALAVVALAGLAYVSTVALRLEAERAATAREAALEENVRLALWRLDSYLSTMIALENAQPAEAFSPDSTAPRSRFVRNRYFAEAWPTPGSETSRPTSAAFLDALNHYRPIDDPRTDAGTSLNGSNLSQAARNDLEFQNRAIQNTSLNLEVQSLTQNALPTSDGMMRPVWINHELYLGRQLPFRTQAVALDWPKLQRDLAARIADLLPGAQLIPLDGATASPGRTLAALPVAIVPGTVPAPVSGRSAVATALSFAWAAAAAALIAIAALLAASIGLAERRAAFVSAVTHELRTPLTTLKLYTEMLATGMVRDDEQRGHYLETLQREADRLGHLVENVLAYSRLEGRRRAPLETVAVGEVLGRSSDRLAELARRAGLRLELTDPDGLSGLRVQADRAALERVLVNLVDNAGKYAATAADPALRLELARDGQWVVIRVCDTGPGIPPSVRRRLFRPFSRSAAEAAGSAPGVGLGLALSRRLARGMGGDLSLEGGKGPGANFSVRLKIVT